MLYFKRLPIAAFALLPLAVTANVFAETQTQGQTDQLVVTATRIAQTVDQTLVPVSVLTREDIERSTANTFPELLGQLPGLDFSFSGGNGKQTGVFLRGTSSRHTLILIDGVRAGSATLGEPSIEHLPLDQIERVEVVRGPRSSLYGSDAIGGVIQVFTRKPEQGLHSSARVAAGNKGTSELEAGLNFGSETGSASINISQYNSDGINALNNADPDADGYERRSASIRVHKAVTDTTDVDLSLQHLDAHSEIDSYEGWPVAVPRLQNDYTDTVQQTLGLRFNSELSDSLSISGGLGQHRDKLTTVDANPSNIRTRRRSADIKFDRYINDDQILTAGMDFQNDKVAKSDTNYKRTSRDNLGLFGQWQNQWQALSLLAGVRYDDNEHFGGQATGNLNFGYQLDSKRRMLAAIGTGFKAPTFNDLFWPGSESPDLVPEESQTFELGYEMRAQSFNYAVRLFQTDIDNLIAWAPAPGSGIWKPSNIQHARIKGLELETGLSYQQWRASANLTLLDPRDQDSDKRLHVRTSRTLQLDLSRRFNSLTATASLLAQGDRYSDAANTNRLPGYGLINLKGIYQLAPNWALEAKVNNLFNKSYSTSANNDFYYNLYQGLDRTYLLSLSYNR